MTETKTQARDAWLDNAKIAILSLVILGHLLEHYRAQNQAVHLIYNALYLFHMPAIIFIAGYFCRPARTAKSFVKALQNSLLPYLSIKVIFLVIFGLLALQWPAFQDYNPAQGLWFLLCLFYWVLAVSTVARLPYILPVSIILAIAIGYSAAIGTTWSLSRAIVFFPFFLAGYLSNPSWLQRIRSVPFWVAVAMFSASTAIATFAIAPHIATNLYYAKFSFTQMSLTTELGAIYRIAHLILAAMASVGFLALIPKSRNMFTVLGESTIYIYLFHLLPIHFAHATGILPTEFGPAAGLMIVGLLLFSIWAFTRRRLVNVLRPLVEGTFLNKLWR